MFQVLKAGNEIFFNLISGLFGTVAKIYDILLKLVQENGMSDSVQLDDISTTIYVVAGVFMLFRVVISMIQMLINPDQMTDKNAGAGKLIVRVVSCIIMLMVFVPNGLVFGSSGLLTRLQSALLAEDGLVTRIGNMSGEIKIIDTGSDSKKSTSTTSSSSSTKKADLTCYYINEEHQAYAAGYKGKKTVTINSMYKIDFYKGTGGEKTIAGTNYTYTDRSGQRIAGKDNNGTYSQLPAQISKGNVFNDGNFSRCPKSFNQGSTYLISEKINQTAGIKGGWTSLSEVASYLKQLKRSNDYIIDTDITFIRTNSETNKKYVSKSNAESIAFAQKTASTLQECAEDKANECEEAQSMMFVTLDGDDAIVNLMDSGDLKVDLFLSLIAGFGLVVYLLLLCIEVIIREFKLYLLEMIAPVAIISHVDPKDKVFGQWSKMLISVYVDLFIKLIAIGFAITLLNRVMDSFNAADGGLLVKFFYIVAILVFAKLVPTMISKIFGLDSMGGSFKDIGKMTKAAAGFGAGAVLGGAVGAMTGKGAGRLSGLAKGALMGAGSGAKGKITAGAQGISQKNAKINEGKANGLNFFQRSAASLAGSVGVNPKTRMDNQIKDIVDKKALLDKFRKHKDNVENMAESSNYLSDAKAKINVNPDSYTYGNLRGKEAFKKARSDFIALNETNKKGDNGNIWHYDSGTKQWTDTGQSDYYYDANGQATSIKFEAAAYGKIDQAETLMRKDLEVNTTLQRELGKTSKDMVNFKAYEDAEKIAKDKSNAYEVEIAAVQSSDKYGRATAMESYSKKQ